MSSDRATSWAPRLAAALAGSGGPIIRVTVIEKTGSTQDAARRLAARPGDVVVACRQTAGRGRLGRTWADTADEGVAASFVIEARAPQRLALAAAVGTATGIESVLGRPVGIKWPNDVVAAAADPLAGRKLAGILVEQSGGVAVIGVGVNVAQRSWPPPLAGRAASLGELGAAAGRITVLEALLKSMNGALSLDDGALRAAFAARDVLAGTRCTFRRGKAAITGTVLRVDPMRGLLVLTDRQEEVFLPAATTTVVRAGEPRGPRGDNERDGKG